MPLRALLIVLVAAALHTGWNFALRGAGDAAAKEVLARWALVAGAVLAAPALLLGPPIPAEVWPYALSGWCVLGERFGLVRAIGSALIFVGIVLVASSTH